MDATRLDLHDDTDDAIAAWSRLRPGADLRQLATSLRIRRLATLITDELAAAVFRSGFAVFGDYEVAALLRRSDAPVQPSEIAHRLLLTRPGVTGRLDRMEQLGLIVRKHDTHDARVVRASLTPKGRRRVDAAFDAIDKRHRQLFQSLDEHDVEALADLLRRVLSSLDGGAS